MITTLDIKVNCFCILLQLLLIINVYIYILIPQFLSHNIQYTKSSSWETISYTFWDLWGSVVRQFRIGKVLLCSLATNEVALTKWPFRPTGVLRTNWNVLPLLNFSLGISCWGKLCREVDNNIWKELKHNIIYMMASKVPPLLPHASLPRYFLFYFSKSYQLL